MNKACLLRRRRLRPLGSLLLLLLLATVATTSTASSARAEAIPTPAPPISPDSPDRRGGSAEPPYGQEPVESPSLSGAPGLPVGIADGDHLLASPEALATWIEDRHPAVAAAAAEVEAAAAELDQAGVIPNPAFDVTAENMAVGRKVRTDVGFTAAYDMGLSQTIELGKRGPRQEAAKQRLEAARQELRKTRSETVAEARLALAQVTFLEGRQRILAESLELTRRSLGLESRRHQLGDISGTDLNRLRLDAIDLEAEFSLGQAELDAAAASCAATLGAVCVIRGEGSVLLDRAAALPPRLDESRLQTLPSLRALQHHRAAEEEEAVLAGRSLIPDPTFRVGYVSDRFSLSNDDPYTLGVGVSVPLPVFDRGQHQAASARARARALSRQAALLQADASAEFAGLQHKRSRLEATRTILGQEALPRSESVLDSTSAAFRQGEIGMTDLLLARQGHTRLQLRALDLQFELFAVRNQLRRLLSLDTDTDR